MKPFARLALALLLVAPSLAAQPRGAHHDAGTHVDVPHAQPDAPPTALCCCRAWSHGWQYGWRDAPACTAGNGTCVSPDHC